MTTMNRFMTQLERCEIGLRDDQTCNNEGLSYIWCSVHTESSGVEATWNNVFCYSA